MTTGNEFVILKLMMQNSSFIRNEDNAFKAKACAAAPWDIAKQLDGGARLCIDMIRRNDITVKGVIRI